MACHTAVHTAINTINYSVHHGHMMHRSVVQFYFNTSYDRLSYEAGRLDIVKLPSGSYRVAGIIYPQ